MTGHLAFQEWLRRDVGPESKPLIGVGMPGPSNLCLIDHGYVRIPDSSHSTRKHLPHLAEHFMSNLDKLVLKVMSHP